jgi:GR25 family glycosyltransferase involved in LPS biosynthesis
MKTCLYVNLPQATERRVSLEASFAASSPGDWTLRRFEALGPADVAHIPGGVRPAEKACFASHRAALESTLDDEDPVMIVEDDVMFAPGACGTLEALLAVPAAYDIIYGDVAAYDLPFLIELARWRDPAVTRREAQVLALAGRSFAGSSAYIVRGSAKRRLHAALAAPAALDQPLDIFLRDLANNGAFRMGVAFPFFTAPAPLADGASQIQLDGSSSIDAAFNILCRTFWAARDTQQAADDLAWLQAKTDGETQQLLGGLFAAFASASFPIYR